MNVTNKRKIKLYERHHFSNCEIPNVNTEGRLMAINDKFLAIPWINPGEINIAYANNAGDLYSNNFFMYETENSNILDLEFHPFNSNILACTNENNSVIITKIKVQEDNKCDIISTRHEFHKDKVNLINFNPIACNVICSCSENGELLIIDIEQSISFGEYNLTNSPNTVTWSPDGSLIGITTNSNFLHIVDPRCKKIILNKILNELNNFNPRFCWVDTNIITCTVSDPQGFNYLKFLDIENNNSFIYSKNLGKNISQVKPYVDPELKLIYSIGKNEYNIKVFDFSQGILQEYPSYKCKEQNTFSIQLNRKYLDKNAFELDKFARLTNNKNIYYEVFSFENMKINNSEKFYPNEELSKMQLTSEQWFSYDNSQLKDKAINRRKSSENNLKIPPQNMKSSEQNTYKKPNNNINNSGTCSKKNKVNISLEKGGIGQKYINNNIKIEPKNPNISSQTKSCPQEKKESKCNYCNCCVSLKKQIQELEENKNKLAKENSKIREQNVKYNSEISSLKKNIEFYKNKSIIKANCYP